MPDIAKYLPLSQRPAVDESGVSRHWGAQIAGVVDQVAQLLESLSAEQWEAPSLCEKWRVRDVAGHLVWRLGSDNRTMLINGLRALWRNRFSVAGAIDEVSRAAAEASTEQLVAELRAIAVRKREGRGRRGVSELAEALVHSYDITNPLGLPFPVESTVTGAVALSRTLILPTRLRVVVKSRTLVATDADWHMGHGPEILGTSEAIVLFLFGRMPLPGSATPQTS